MSQSEIKLPPGWERQPDYGYYMWTDPKEDGTPDVYITRLGDKWEVQYWLRKAEDWQTALVPPSPEPPFELAEALYYAAQ